MDSHLQCQGPSSLLALRPFKKVASGMSDHTPLTRSFFVLGALGDWWALLSQSGLHGLVSKSSGFYLLNSSLISMATAHYSWIHRPSNAATRFNDKSLLEVKASILISHNWNASSYLETRRYFQRKKCMMDHQFRYLLVIFHLPMLDLRLAVCLMEHF